MVDRESKRRVRCNLQPRLSVSSKLFTLCSFMCILFPVIASINGCIQGSASSLTQSKSGGFMFPCQAEFGLAANGDFTSQLSCLDCHWKSRIYEPVLRRKVNHKMQVFNCASLLRGLVLSCLYAFSFVVFNVLVLFTFVVARLSAHETVQGQQPPFKDSLLLFSILFSLSVQMFIFQESTTRAVIKRNVFSVLGRKKSKRKQLSSKSFSVNSLVGMLLFMSGDVELNPGPMDGKKKVTASKGSSDLEPQPLDDKEDKQNTVSKGSSSNVEIKPKPDDKKPVSIEQNAAPKVGSSPLEQNTTTNDRSTSEQIPKSQHQRRVSQPLLHLHTEDRQNQSPHSSTQSEALLVQTRDDTNNGTHLPIEESNDGQVDGATKPNGSEVCEETKSKESNILELKSQLQGKKQWAKGVGFQTTTAVEVKQILITANQLYRSGGKCPLCIRCGRLKRESINSHIFPRSVLDVYKQVHCSGTENFIHDFSRFDKGKGRYIRKPKDLGYQLHCQYCEQLLGKVEGNLKSVYLLVLAHTENTVSLQNKDCWFPFILTNIMFRGILVGGSLECLLNEFEEEFHKLWNSALTKSHFCGIRLFLLPNCCISHSNTHFLYALELLIRNPSYTELYQSEVGGKFLYTHFDCFHLVLPLDKKSSDYFDTYRSVSVVCDPVVLARTTYPNVKVTDLHHTFEYVGDASIYFPDALLTISAERYPTYSVKLTREDRTSSGVQSSANDTPRLFTIYSPNEEPNYCPSGQTLTTCPVSTTAEVDPGHIHYKCESSREDSKAKKYTKADVDTKSTYKTLVEIATGYSPLAKPFKTSVRVKQLEKKIEDMTKDIQYEKELMRKERDQLSRNVEEQNLDRKRWIVRFMRMERRCLQLMEEREKLSDQMKKLRPLITKVAKLENEVEKLTTENSKLKEKYLCKQVQVNHLSEQNEQLKRKLKLQESIQTQKD